MFVFNNKISGLKTGTFAENSISNFFKYQYQDHNTFAIHNKDERLKLSSQKWMKTFAGTVDFHFSGTFKA